MTSGTFVYDVLFTVHTVNLPMLVVGYSSKSVLRVYKLASSFKGISEYVWFTEMTEMGRSICCSVQLFFLLPH